MKKALVVVGIMVAVAALVAWVATWFRDDHAVASSAAQPWPAGLGTLDAVGKRLQPLKANPASVRLTALSKALPQNDVVETFVTREVTRGERTIGEPPALPDVTAIRQLALQEPVVWERHEGIDHEGTMTMRGVQMTIARALVADALVKAPANDPLAWEDLHAVWKLARTLDGHPQMMAQTAALSMARMVNAVAWKMPLPAPAWFEELQSRDQLGPLLAAFQYQAASYWSDGVQLFPTKLLAESVEHDRLIAQKVSQLTTCDVIVPMNKLGVDVASVWRRAFRYRAEREATANAIRLREGRPIEPTSRCTDGAWTVDGPTLRFSRPIETAPPDRPMPLVLQVTN
jgi:hypothetical protein